MQKSLALIVPDCLKPHQTQVVTACLFGFAKINCSPSMWSANLADHGSSANPLTQNQKLFPEVVDGTQLRPEAIDAALFISPIDPSFLPLISSLHQSRSPIGIIGDSAHWIVGQLKIEAEIAEANDPLDDYLSDRENKLLTHAGASSPLPLIELFSGIERLISELGEMA